MKHAQLSRLLLSSSLVVPMKRVRGMTEMRSSSEIVCEGPGIKYTMVLCLE